MALWAASVAINLLALGLPIFILLIYDRVLPNNGTDTLIVLTVGLLVVALVDTALKLGRTHVLNWSATLFEHRTNCSALNHLLSSEPNDYEKVSPGTHLDRMAAVQALRGYYGSEARLQVLDLPFAVLFLGLIWALAGALVWVPIVILSVVLLIGMRLGTRLREVLVARSGVDEKRQSLLLEILGSVQSIKGRQMEPLMQRRYERLQEAGSKLTYDVVVSSQAAQALGAIAANLTFLSVGAIGAVSVINGNLTIGELAAATLLSGRAVQPTLSSLALWTRFQSLRVARTRIADLFDVKLEPAASDGDIDTTLQQGIRLENVSFSDDEEPIRLQGINLEVKVGEIIGITGNTASGKSLLLRLMTGDLKPTDGRVLFDGKDIAEVPRARLRTLVSHVSPNPALFKGKLIENLCLFRGSGHVGRALMASSAVGLDRIVNRLPRGYETMIGSAAEGELSLGVRQMIATTRALAQNPRLLLLYQVDSSLDQGADQALREVLLKTKKNAAIVVVSQRPSTLAIADRRYRMADGTLQPIAEEQVPVSIAGAA